MAKSFSYTISTDTANGLLHEAALHKQIKDSAIESPLDRVDSDADNLTVHFTSDLSAGDETLLDGVVAAHDGEALPLAPQEVVTQREKPDKILKMASCEAEVQGDSTATADLKVPGTFNGVDGDAGCSGRWIDAGTAWISNVAPGDRVCEVSVVDKDNLLGYGANTVIKTYHDDEVAEAEKGWYLNNNQGMVQVDAMGGYGFLPSGLYLRIKAKKAGGVTTGTLYVNLKWGKAE